MIININEAAIGTQRKHSLENLEADSDFPSDDKLMTEAIMSLQATDENSKKTPQAHLHQLTDHPGLETDIFGFQTKSNDKSPTRVTFEASKAIEFLRRNNSNYFIDLFSKK